MTKISKCCPRGIKGSDFGEMLIYYGHASCWLLFFWLALPIRFSHFSRSAQRIVIRLRVFLPIFSVNLPSDTSLLSTSKFFLPYKIINKWVHLFHNFRSFLPFSCSGSRHQRSSCASVIYFFNDTLFHRFSRYSTTFFIIKGSVHYNILSLTITE